MNLNGRRCYIFIYSYFLFFALTLENVLYVSMEIVLNTKIRTFKDRLIKGLPWRWLRLHPSAAGGMVPFLVGELRSHVPRGAAKKKKAY